VRLVLASDSPRRRQLLESLLLEFDVVPSEVDETRLPGEAPGAYVLRLARAKAEAVAGPGTVALGADTVVVHRGRLLGKPGHPAEARSMLERLSGEAHTVFTGVAVASWDDGLAVRSEVERAVVYFHELTEGEITAYVASGEPMDKAGAYALQGLGGVFVRRIEGTPTTVVGLPIDLAARLLRSAGVTVLGGRS
jgi:septum formation protein